MPYSTFLSGNTIVMLPGNVVLLYRPMLLKLNWINYRYAWHLLSLGPMARQQLDKGESGMPLENGVAPQRESPQY